MSCRVILAGMLVLFAASCHPRLSGSVRDRDRRRDVEVVTSRGNIILRLSDSTPLHRDNFLKLVKMGFYDNVTFHRVIKGFVIQTGDPLSKDDRRKDTAVGGGGPGYTVPAELRASLYHKRGALGAAREGDDVNPTRASSGSQFYIVQGKEGARRLDTKYTVFGEVVSGMETVDSIAAVATSGRPLDRPLSPVRILKMRLIKRSEPSVK